MKSQYLVICFEIQMTNINEFDCQGGSPNQYFIEFRILTILDNGCTGKCHDSDQGSNDNV